MVTGAMAEYAHQVCWISNTYYLPRNQAPLTRDQPRDSVLIYYQVCLIRLKKQLFAIAIATNLLYYIFVSIRDFLHPMLPA